MARTNIALLSEEPIVSAADSADNGDALQLEIAQGEQQIKQQTDAVENAEDARDHLVAQKELIESTDAPPAVAMQMAAESLKLASRLTGNQFKRARASLENDDPDAGEVTKELGEAADTIDEQISVAQEGLVENIGFHLGKIFVSIDKMQARAKDAGEKEVKEQTTISKAAFTRNITLRKSEGIVTGADTIESVGKVYKLADQSKLSSTAKKVKDLIAKISIDANGTTFKYTEEQAKNVAQVQQEVEQLAQQVKGLVEKSAQIVDATTLTDKELKTLAKELQNASAQRNATAEMLVDITNYFTEKFSANVMDFLAHPGSVGGKIAESLIDSQRAYRQFERSFNRIVTAFDEVYDALNDVTYAAVRHMEASVAG